MIFEGVQVEGGVQEALELQEVRVLAAGGRSSGRFTSSIPNTHTHTSVCHMQLLIKHEYVLNVLSDVCSVLEHYCVTPFVISMYSKQEVIWDSFQLCIY